MYRRRRRPRWLLDFSRLLYRLLLFLYPAPFRRDFGGEMTQLFGDLSAEAYRCRGARGLARLWLDTLWDLVVSGLREHLARAHRPHARPGPAAADAGTPPRDLGRVSRMEGWPGAGDPDPFVQTVLRKLRYRGRVQAEYADRVTGRARQVLRQAREEALRFNHSHIGTEHLLLGLIHENEGVAARVLEGLEGDPQRIRNAVEFIIGRGDRPISGEIALTSRAWKVLDLTIEEAQRLGQRHIGTEHVLLGLVREGQGIAAGVLESQGINLGRVREQTHMVLSRPTEPRRWPQPGDMLQGGSPGNFDRLDEGARRVLALAQAEAQRFKHNYIGTEHVLLGLVREGDGVAARVLRRLGVSLDDVRERVERIIGRGDRIVLGEIGLKPRAKKVIELAVDESSRLGHHHIGTEHLLLGLVREGEGIAAGVLESLGVRLEHVRSETARLLEERGGRDEDEGMGT